MITKFQFHSMITDHLGLNIMEFRNINIFHT